MLRSHKKSRAKTAVSARLFIGSRTQEDVSLSRISLRHDGDDADGVRHLRGGDDGEGALPSLRAFR